MDGDNQQRLNADLAADANAAMAAANNIPADLAVLRNLAEADAGSMRFAQELANQRLEVIRRQLPGMGREQFRNLILPDGLQGEVNRTALADIRSGLAEIQAQNEVYFRDDIRQLSDTALQSVARQIGNATDDVLMRRQVAGALGRDAEDPIVTRLAARNHALNNRDRNRQMADRVAAIKAELDRRGVRKPTAFRNLVGRDADQRRADEAVNGVVDPINPEAAGALAQRIADQKKRYRDAVDASFRERFGDDRPWEDPAINIPVDQLDADNIEGWARQVFDGVTGTDRRGRVLKTRVTSVRQMGGSHVINGSILAIDADGNERVAGKFTRHIDPDKKMVYNAYFALNKEYRGSGMATVFNNQAFAWYKASGFERVEVSPALEDGGWVWPKMGFAQKADSADDKASATARLQRLVAGMKQQLESRDAGRESLIDSDQNAEMIRGLIAKAEAANFDPDVSPRHYDFMMAITPRTKTQQKKIKREFKANGWDLHNTRAALDLTVGKYVSPLRSPNSMGYEPRDPRTDMLMVDLGAVPGDVPVPRRIKNRNIRSQTAANRFVKEGGNINEVPNEYLLEAIQQNASQDEVDATTRFRQIPKNGGIIGDTRIFVIRGEDGKAGTHGFVLKGASIDDSVAEIVANNFAAAHGIIKDGGAWDGRGGRRQYMFAVIPHAFNAAPDGDVRMVTNGQENYHPAGLRGTIDDGHPQLLGHALHEYLMNVSDRHKGNGMTLRVGDQAVVVPIDAGWAGRGGAPDVTVSQWVRGTFSMNKQVLTNVKSYHDGLDPDKQREFRAKIRTVVDDMIERSGRVSQLTADELLAKYLPDREVLRKSGVPEQEIHGLVAAARQKVTIIQSQYAVRSRNLRRDRNTILKTLLGDGYAN